jgi:hypothetical protein
MNPSEVGDPMEIATRKADQRARLVLPDDFANETVVIERINANELRLRKKKKTLAQLVAGITPDNLHGEWDTGPDLGKVAPPANAANGT